MLDQLMIRLYISCSRQSVLDSLPLSEKQCSFQYNESYILARMTFSTKNCNISLVQCRERKSCTCGLVPWIASASFGLLELAIVLVNV
jgi:hypothetical protein